MHEGGQHAEGGEHGGRVVDIGCGSLRGSSRYASNIHRTRHGLAHSVEAAAFAIRPCIAKGRLRREDDVGPDRTQRCVVEPKGDQARRRKVGNDHIGRRARGAAMISAASGLAQLESQRAFVAGGLEQHGTLAAAW